VANAIGDTEAIVVKHCKEWIVDEDLLQKLPQRTFGAQAWLWSLPKNDNAEDAQPAPRCRVTSSSLKSGRQLSAN